MESITTDGVVTTLNVVDPADGLVVASIERETPVEHIDDEVFAALKALELGDDGPVAALFH